MEKRTCELCVKADVCKWHDGTYTICDSFVDRRVDVVRCKDCKWHSFCSQRILRLRPDFFCAYGERKNGGAEQ